MPLLACGAELKNTFCLAKDGRAWVSHHVGDLGEHETLRSLHEGVEPLPAAVRRRPRGRRPRPPPRVPLDRLTRSSRTASRLVGVQHHHAHLAACLAEHGVSGPAVGAIFDGTGYGLDGRSGAARSWPAGSPTPTAPVTCGRSACRAARRPSASRGGWPAPGSPTPSTRSGHRRRPWRRSSTNGAGRSSPGSPDTPSSRPPRRASAGSSTPSPRICGLRAVARYEGQAAIELEAAAASAGPAGAYELELLDGVDGVVIDPRPALRAIVRELERGDPAAAVAARFHAGVAAASAAACVAVAARRGIDTAVLSGGVFANRLLVRAIAAELERCGLHVLVPQRLPAGDGGISYGQAAVAAARA